jgi:hypothetical protein
VRPHWIAKLRGYVDNDKVKANKCDPIESQIYRMVNKVRVTGAASLFTLSQTRTIVASSESVGVRSWRVPDMPLLSRSRYYLCVVSVDRSPAMPRGGDSMEAACHKAQSLLCRGAVFLHSVPFLKT